MTKTKCREYGKIMTLIDRIEHRLNTVYEWAPHPDVVDQEIDFLYYLVHRAAVRLDSLEEIKEIAQRVNSITYCPVE